MKQDPKMIGDLLPLEECSLFQSEHSRNNILQCLKTNKLFRAKLRPLRCLNSSKNDKAKSDDSENQQSFDQSIWLDQINYCDPGSCYEPKRASLYAKQVDKQNKQKQNLLQIELKKRKANCKQFKLKNKNKYELQKELKSSNKNILAVGYDKKIKSLHIENCRMMKMKKLNETAIQFRKQKLTQFNRLWPDLTCTNIKKSLQRLKKLKVEPLNQLSLLRNVDLIGIGCIRQGNRRIKRKQEDKREIKNNLLMRFNKEQKTQHTHEKLEYHNQNVPQFLMLSIKI